jgi:putative PIN family toxin of toxin-antitoxin system
VQKHAVLVAVSTTDESNVFPQCRDPKDDQFLALALACEANVLVSSDADLLVLHPWREVPIVTPGDFLNRQ